MQSSSTLSTTYTVPCMYVCLVLDQIRNTVDVSFLCSKRQGRSVKLIIFCNKGLCHDGLALGNTQNFTYSTIVRIHVCSTVNQASYGSDCAIFSSIHQSCLVALV